MGNWINRTTSQEVLSASPTMMRKAYGGNFVDGAGKAQSNPDWIYMPVIDLATRAFDSKYWDINGDVVSLKSEDDRDAIDVVEEDARLTAEVDAMDNRLLRVVLAKLNVVEANDGITLTTMDAAKAEAKLGN